MNAFVKGRTNNHLTFAMVDATDFATPESALSAAMKIKIYGKLRGATGVNFVSSGTGSLANDIQHVGPSVLGIYTIALAKADLSDASAAWYDQYVISLSATGAAYQMLVVDGGIDASALLVLSDAVSNVYSALLLTQSLASDAASAAAQANSRVLLVQSRLSDFDSRMVSDVSDLYSLLSSLNSEFLSRITSVVGTSSDVVSKIWADATATALASRVLVIKSMASDAHSAAAQGNSRVLVVQSMVSDTQSKLSDVESNLLSFLATTGVQLNASSLSDIRSAITAGATGLDASALSDIASAVVAAIGAQGVALDASTMSDLRSSILSLSAMLSDVHSAATAGASRILVVQSMVSDTQSKLSDVESNLLSFLATTGVQINASSLSDLRSAITAGATGLDASALSDIASAVVAAITAQGVGLDASTMSDIRSAITVVASMASDAASAAQQGSSRVLLIQSRLSDLDSRIASDISDTLSAVGVANSRLLLNQSRISDVQSALAAGVEIGASSMSDIRSSVLSLSGMLSDAHSAAAQANSRAVLLQSAVSDIQSAVAVIPSAKLAAHGAAVLVLVVGVGSTTTAVKFSTVEGGAPSAVNDFYNGRTIVFSSGALAGQATSISDYDGATTTATVVALTGAPANAVTGVIA